MSAFFKDIFREIRNAPGRFFGILAIVMLGVAFYGGLGATGNDMRLTGDTFCDNQRLMDIRVVSTMGLNEDDITAIKAVAGVEQVVATYTLDAMAFNTDRSTIVKIHAFDIAAMDAERVNNPLLLEGRLPQKNNEALVERSFLRSLGLRVGDTFTLTSGKKADIRNKLRFNRFTVVGVVESPYYVSRDRGTGSVGNGLVDCYIYVPQAAFLMPIYTEAYVIVEGAARLNAFSDAYDDLIEEVVSKLENVGDIRAQKRFVELTAGRYAAITAAEFELNDSEATASIIFEETEKTIADAEKQLSAAFDDLLRNQRELDNQTAEMLAREAKLISGKNELLDGIAAITSTENDLLNDLNSINQNRSYMSNEEYYANLDGLENGLAQISAARDGLLNTQAILNVSQATIERAKKQIVVAQAQLSDGLRIITQKRSSLAEQNNDFQAQKLESQQKINAARITLADSRSALDKLDTPKWYILDRGTNPGFSSYSDDSDKITAIGQVFPLIFFIVAALVSLTSITRLVDERRTEIGTLKSLGYGNFTIMMKYIIYAALPTLIGGFIGGFVGMKFFPVTIMTAYSLLYTIPQPQTPMDYGVWLTGISLGVGCTLFAAIYSCANELRETPSNLMRPRAPKAGKRTFLEKIPILWNNLKFTHKVTIRNLFRYKKRFFMTIIGIGGCTALLITGFGVRDSVSDIVGNQFSKVYIYNQIIGLTDTSKSGDLKKVRDELRQSPIVNNSISAYSKSMDAYGGNGRVISCSVIAPEDLEKLRYFINFQDRVTGDTLPLSESGVVITEKLSTLLDLKVGDTLTLKDSDSKFIDVQIEGITEHYFMHNVYMSKTQYEFIYNEPPEYNMIYSIVNRDEINRLKLAESLLDLKGVAVVQYMDEMIDSFDDMIASLNSVIIVLIVSAGALAFIVLLNLTNINITERKRELATIAVLGFYDKEISAYIFRENALLTLIGSVVGMVFGVFLHLYVVLSAETEMIMFGREVKFMSYVYSIALTILFSLLVNWVSAGKLKKINMVEALKSVE